MLSKLLKHEFKATARLLLPLYLVLLVLTIVDRIALGIDFKGALEVIPGFATFAYITSIIAIAVISLVIVISRFYKNLMTDEGYLMFTLPVKPFQLINSKLLISMFWNLISMVLIIASLFGVFINQERYGMLKDGLHMVVAEMSKEFGAYNMTLLTVELIALIIIALINNILIIYASIAIGQLFNGHKVLGSFAAFIGISTVLQIIITLVLVSLGAIFHRTFEEINSLPQIVFPISIGMTVIANVLFYWITNHIFQRRLNLE